MDASPLDASLRECEAAHAVADARVDRLLGEVFTNADGARRAVRTLLRTSGLEETVRLVTNLDTLRGAWLFGSTRDSLLHLGRRRNTGRALEELPQALRDRQELADRLADLKQARRALLERADLERLHVPRQVEHGRERD